MVFLGRSRELGQIRSLMDRDSPLVLRVVGPKGTGKTALVERALESFRSIGCRIPPLPEAQQREAVHRQVLGALAAHGLPSEIEGDDWGHLFQSVVGLADQAGASCALVLDDAHHLQDARARYLPPLLNALGKAAEGGRTVHAILVGSSGGIPEALRMAPLHSETIDVGPLPFRAACLALPGSTSVERLRAYAVFGGLPAVIGLLDRSVTTETNARRLMLDDRGALADVGGKWLERDLQTPNRYHAILAALAAGESDWAAVHAGVSDLTTSGQVAPYLRRLEQLGLIETRQSLDARSGSRGRRYRIADPLFAFWYRYVFPSRNGPLRPPAADELVRSIRARFDDHIGTIFPHICRQHAEYDAIETLGSNAREVGGLWATSYDLPVAGVLGSGAVFYGSCHWSPIVRGEDPLAKLDAQIRETRYGFGRQQRLRLLFTRDPAPRWLQREIAKRSDAQIVTADDLVGGD